MSLPIMGFARPELLLLLAILPLVAALLARAYRARARSLRAFAGAAPLLSRSGARWWLNATLLLVALSALLVAIAGPYVDLRPRTARRLGVDLVMAVDVSQSMGVRDVDPDRLRAARHVVEELGRELIGSRVALVLFAGQGTLRYPPTTDPRIMGEVLDNSARGFRLQQGSSLRSGIESSFGAFAPDLDPLRRRALIVVSDGEMTVGDIPSTEELRDKGARIYAVGIGTPKGGQIPTYDTANGKFTGYIRGPDGVPVISRLNEDSLRLIAERGGGRYWRYTDDAVIGEIAADLRTLEAIEPLDASGAIPDERVAPFVGIAVGALLLEWLIPGARRMPTPRGASPGGPRGAKPTGGKSSGGRTGGGGAPGRVATWRVLGLAIGSTVLWGIGCSDAAISNETANGLFAAGDYRGALNAYRDLQQSLPDSPELAINAGNALHMLGEHGRALTDYSRAIEATDPKLRATAQYDRGNTLFRLGRLEEARDAYKEALRLAAGDRDAKFNLELTLRILAPRQPTTTGQQAGQGQQSGQQGPGQGQSGAPRATGSPQPGQQPGEGQPSGDPTDSRTPGGSPPPGIRPALDEFRKGLTIDEALRVLDALRGEQRGIGQLLEGPRSGAAGGQY